jgi:hypothetical protein
MFLLICESGKCPCSQKKRQTFRTAGKGRYITDAKFTQLTVKRQNKDAAISNNSSGHSSTSVYFKLR